MEYQKTNVNAFLGLDNNQRPELIKNEEASDIENLRFEKLGYLINRNGVQAHPLYLSRYMDIADISGILWSIGTVGMTEYVIEKPWGIGSGEIGVAPYDDFTLGVYSPTAQGESKYTDRFMVYCMRIPAAKAGASSARTDRNNETNLNTATGFTTAPENLYTWRYKAAYVLMPLTGPVGWRDQFAFAPNANKLSLSSSNTGSAIPANGANQLLSGTYYRISAGTANLTAAPYVGNIQIKRVYGTNAAATAGTIIYVTSTITLPVTAGLVWYAAALSYEPEDLTLPSLYATFGSRSILKPDDKPNKLQIYAPSRWLGVHNQFHTGGTPKDLNWIEHYVSMQQYRDSLVISDMTNGDMYLVDEYSESEYQDTKKHRFSLRENALAHFNVDDVIIDFGIGVSQFNQGVKAPMALYKFYLSRNTFTPTRDNYEAQFINVSESPSYSKLYKDGLDDKTLEFHQKWKCLPYTEVKSFLAIEYWAADDDEYKGSSISINNTTPYVFSNQQDADEYDDLFGTLTLANPDIKEDDQVSSDVYIWDDLEIDYFPVSGTIQNQLFLTAKDRTWDKTNSAGTKIIKVKNHKGFEQDVPLGVWRYRFVWYLGNGEYSAPSSELVVPDLLFSGLSDADIVNAYGSYQRPVGIANSDDALRTNIDMSNVNVQFHTENAQAQGIKIFATGANPSELVLTSYGSNFVKIKKMLLEPYHKFGAYYSSTNGASWPTNWTTESLLTKGNLSVICTLYPGNDTLPLSGVVAQIGNSSYGVERADEPINILNYAPSEVPLNVPMFSDYNDSAQYNSVFTKYGVIRTIYQAKSIDSFGGATIVQEIDKPVYQIVLEGYHRFGWGDQDSAGGNQSIENDVVSKGKSVYFAVVPFDGAISGPQLLNFERENQDDDTLYPAASTIYRWAYRNMTQARGVRLQGDRLANIKPGVKAQAISRLVLSGSAEIELCNYQDKGTVAFQNLTKNSTNPTDYDPFPQDSGLLDTQDYLSRNVNLVSSTSGFFGAANYKTRVFTQMPSGQNGVFSRSWSWVRNASLATMQNYVSFAYKAWGDALDSAGELANRRRIVLDNLKVAVSMPGERLTISEQLSMYVPASLLFNAPHIKLVVPANRIPRRARQLMVFRTKASHDNDWQPTQYGMVKAIDVIRDGNGSPSGAHLNAIEFLDDVKNEDLDFSYELSDYDGFTRPISSRFCLPLNERVFYANIKESYQPHTPRSSVFVVAGDSANNNTHKNLNVSTQTELERLWSYRLVSDGATTNITKQYLYYFIAYNDQARSYSFASSSGQIFRNGVTKPVMFCLPSAYDAAVEQANIYRLQLSAPITSISIQWPLTTHPTPIVPNKVYFVQQGVVEYNGQVYYPNDVIYTFDGFDIGYDGTRVNKFRNYFANGGAADTDRGHGKSYSYPILYDITDYFDGASGGAGLDFMEKVGTIKPEDEGIFYDNDLPSLGRLPLKQIFQNEDISPAAVRWSEPYQPNKIKLASLMEVRSGDGDQITGLTMLYGNLVVLKERSLHRLAVQGAAVPVSRVDEVSNNVGCIAPNTAITVNNTLYFLSWAGFYKYDNNQLSKIDGKFAEELQLRLRSAQDGVINPAIRDASCGWNPTYRELYLTIPIMSTTTNEGDLQGNYGGGVTITDNKGTRQLRGVTYAINVDSGLVTKYRYMDDAVYHTDPPTWPGQIYPLSPTQRAPRVYSRLYYTNTLGQLRSGEVLPPRTKNYLLPFVPPPEEASAEFLRVSHFIESPTKDGNNKDKHTDDYLMFTQSLINPLIFTIEKATKFVRVFWSSKSWTLEDKSVLKRVRKVFAYIAASNESAIIRGIVHTSPEGETAIADTTWQYTYTDTRPGPANGFSVTGEIMAIPTEAAGATSSPSQNRGERHTFNVEGSGSFQMEYFGFYWKAINQYER